MSTPNERIEDSLVRLESDTSTLNEIVHGPEHETVPTESGPVPTVAELFRQIGERVESVTDAAAKSAEASRVSAESAAASANVAANQVNAAAASAERAEQEAIAAGSAAGQAGAQASTAAESAQQARASAQASSQSANQAVSAAQEAGKKADAAGEAAQTAGAKADRILAAGDASKGAGAVPYDQKLDYQDGSVGAAIRAGGGQAVQKLRDDLADSSSEDGGGHLIAFSQFGATGAVARNINSKARDIVSVLDFGATGNGTTDDTLAIQAAINYVRSKPNGVLYFPPRRPGMYFRITAPLLINGPIKIRGEGPNSTTILGVGMAAGSYLIDCNVAAEDVVEHLEISGLTLRSNNNLPSGIRAHNVSYLTVSDVVARSLNHGLTLSGTRTYSNFFDRFTGYAIKGNTVRLDGYNGGGHITFNNCTFSGDAGLTVISNSAVNNLTFTNSNFEQCVSASLAVYGDVFGLSIVGCRTEASNGNDFVINPNSGRSVTGLSVTGCFFTSNSGSSRPIVLGGSGGKVRGFMVAGNHVGYAGTSFVHLNGDGESGVVCGNYLSVSGMLPTNTQRAGVVVHSNESSGGKCPEYWGFAQWGAADGAFTFTDGSGANLELANVAGRYTRIGRNIFWQAYVVYPTTSDTRQASLAGLPLAASGGFVGRTGGTVDATNASLDLAIWHGSPNSSSVSVMNRQTLAAITNAQLSGKQLYLSGHYTI
ncbi:hypothetical protein K32_49410 [Kaistia sp. 32K]|uniref:glycoside hydrolase family 55 protein n=1 Tax=Kaistia sp. 32K TaxID=2795690 RepID=UPI0019165E09|nr:glycoside hydrolase family 55 protein [Kaistia sp. 32K]BCP56324.1 hypothetical protein K32_49410 [Kaistia sp. 32K]